MHQLFEVYAAGFQPHYNIINKHTHTRAYTHTNRGRKRTI